MRSFTTVKRLIIATIWLMGSLALLEAQERPDQQALDIRDPAPYLDSEGRFWIYKDGTTLEHPVPPYGVPFLAYGVMEEDLITIDHRHSSNPYQGNLCLHFSITSWEHPYWCGAGFISGPDASRDGGPWWGKTSYGWYYNLSELQHKRLIVHMRGERGGEGVQVKVGFLAREHYGDSLRSPITAMERTSQGRSKPYLTLTQNWQRYEIPLRHRFEPHEADLRWICSLCFVVTQAEQANPNAPVSFFIDEIYFE